jgi:hypothetical protein
MPGMCTVRLNAKSTHCPGASSDAAASEDHDQRARGETDSGHRQQQTHADVIEQRAADGDCQREAKERRPRTFVIISAECALSMGSKNTR